MSNHRKESHIPTHVMNHSEVSSYSGLRLVRLLSAIGSVDSGVNKEPLAERLGQLMGLSGSVELSRVHDELSEMDDNPAETAGDSSQKRIKDEFIESRNQIVRLVTRSFVPGSKFVRDRLPDSESLYAHFQSTGIRFNKNGKRVKNKAALFEPYRKFYTARQRELDVKTQQLRMDICKKNAVMSPALARLSVIDQAYVKILSQPVREILGKIPGHLEKRFGGLLDIHLEGISEKDIPDELEKGMMPDGFISLFCRDMRDFLLAELEFRLQPVLGMIESLPDAFSSD